MNNNQSLDEAWACVIQKCEHDEKYRNQVIEDPKNALKDFGYTASPDEHIQVMVEKDEKMQLHLSLQKKSQYNKLSVEDLKKVSGGISGGKGG